MITNDQELQLTQERIARLQRLLLQLRSTARPGEFQALASGYRLEIERMQADVLEYLTRPLDPGQPPDLDFEARLQDLYRRFEAGQISLEHFARELGLGVRDLYAALEARGLPTSNIGGTHSSGLQPFIDRWGRYAIPEAEPQPIRFEQYLAWTPEECNKLEMVEGRLQVGNAEDGTQRMLAFLMRAFGLAYTLRLAPASAWQPALAQIGVTVAPDHEWSLLPEPPALSEKDPVLGRRQAASHLAMGVHLQADTRGVSGRWLLGPFAVRPASGAETVLIPDHLYVTAERRHLFQEYFLDGAPDWTLEAPWPGGLNFCRKVKLPLYFQGGAREVWMLDWGHQTVEVYTRADGSSTLASRYGPGDPIQSDLFRDLSLSFDQAIQQEYPSRRAPAVKKESSFHLSRRARPQLEPQLLDADRFAAWRPAEWHKLEIVDGRVYMAGTREEAERALALLLANIGLRGAAELAPPAHWHTALTQTLR